MSYRRIVVFALALALAPAAARTASPHPATPVQAVETLQGAGILQALACAGCLGSGMTAMVMGWGSVWGAAMGAAGGALGSACLDACAGAF